MISLLCPTRGRPKEAERLLKSFQNTQKNENEILFYVQNDDKFKQEYIDLFNKYRLKTFIIGLHMPTSYLWNKLSEFAQGDLLTLIGDDVEILTDHWDDKFEYASKQYKDNIFVITTQDGGPDKKTSQYLPCPHPTVHRRWKEILGYFVPPFFLHRYLDKYTANLGISLNRYIEIKDVVFNHLKFMSINDDTGKLSRLWIKDDRKNFEITKRYFDVDLELLKKNIS